MRGGGGISGLCQRVATDDRFERAVIGVILFNAVLLGLETSRALVAGWGPLFAAANAACQAFFVCEITIRVAARWPRPASFFRSPWNVFDFLVVVASLLPASGTFATVARLARLLRITRLVSLSPQLRLIVGTMLASIPSLGHVVLLLSLILYVYAIAGVHLFRDAAPQYFGTLGTALLSLFQVVTVEGWPDMQAAVMGAHPWAWVYFATFILLAVFVVFNLFVAVVLNNLESAKREQRREDGLDDPAAASAETAAGAASAEIAAELARLRRVVRRLERRLSDRPRGRAGGAQRSGVGPAAG